MKYGLQASPPNNDGKTIAESSQSDKKSESSSDVPVNPVATNKILKENEKSSNEPALFTTVKEIASDAVASEPVVNNGIQTPIDVTCTSDISLPSDDVAIHNIKDEAITPVEIVCKELTISAPGNVHLDKIKNEHTTNPQNICDIPSMVYDMEDVRDAGVLQEPSTEMVLQEPSTEMVSLQEPAIEMVIATDDEIDPDLEMTSVSSQIDVVMSEINSLGIGDALVKSSIKFHFKNAPLIELSRCSWGRNEQKYLRGVIFSPDGTCILTTVNKDGMHIIELPLSLYNNESVTPDRPLDILTSAVHVPEGGTVYDYCWYPFMNSSLPETCCFISTRQHEPIQLWDAFDGKLRCTYRGYDAVDEVEAALSVCFSIDGSQVIAGYRKSLKIFQTNVPGRDYTNFTLKAPASCLAVHSSDENMIAIGSWNSFVTIHDVRSPKLAVTEKLVKHTGGVTLMKFSSDGKRLYTGARKDNKLVVWDIRNVTQPLFNLSRTVENNQKIYFDISWSDEWLISGDTDGIVHAYDLKYGIESGKFFDYQYNLHHDSCNGVSLHPSRPILATSSGQHHFIGFDKEIALKSADIQENSLIFWWCGNPD